METNNLLKLSEKIELCGLEDECIVLEDERADDIYGGKFAPYFFLKISSTMIAMAPSPVTLQAVPKLSMAM